jgi:hypothetical protein
VAAFNRRDITIMNTVDDMFLEHIPFCPPRTAATGERIYLQLWLEFVTKSREEFENIFHDMPYPIDQQVASIAASFMVFMGCNGGADFTNEANRLCSQFDNRQSAFLAAFAIRNQRRSWMNSGLRFAETMLARKPPIEYSGGVSTINWVHVPELTQKDMDALECMVLWWSTPQAERIRDIADPLIVSENRKALSGMFLSENEAGAVHA